MDFVDGLHHEKKKQFCKENNLTEPRDGWDNNLINPNGKCSGPAV